MEQAMTSRPDLRIKNFVFLELPRYISYIVGYSQESGRMYFRDESGDALFSSKDGIRFEITEETEFPSATIIQAVSIPGQAASMADSTWQVATGTGKIYKGKKITCIHQHTKTTC